jgi:hypothetical protein
MTGAVKPCIKKSLNPFFYLNSQTLHQHCLPLSKLHYAIYKYMAVTYNSHKVTNLIINSELGYAFSKGKPKWFYCYSMN